MLNALLSIDSTQLISELSHESTQTMQACTQYDRGGFLSPPVFCSSFGCSLQMGFFLYIADVPMFCLYARLWGGFQLTRYSHLSNRRVGYNKSGVKTHNKMRVSNNRDDAKLTLAPTVLLNTPFCHATWSFLTNSFIFIYAFIGELRVYCCRKNPWCFLALMKNLRNWFPLT